MANTTIQTTTGTGSVNVSTVPFMRAREVEFQADNLRPDRKAQFFFGDINVTRFVQRASRLIPDNANVNNSTVVTIGERLYCNTTHAFASVIGNSSGNTIYINENYIAINVATIGANTLGSADLSVGDILWQVPANTTPLPDNATFEGQVVYWNSSDAVVVLQPIIGSPTINSVANIFATLYKSGSNYTIRASSLVQGNRFPTNSQVASLDNVSNRFLINTYDHRHGVAVSGPAPNANCIVISGTAPSDAVGNIAYICGQTGLGQAGKVLSVSGNVLYTNTTFSPQPQGNSYYGLGQSSIDSTGFLFGIFNIPETQTVQFLTGTQTFTISDSNIVDDPNATMIATGHYTSQGYLGAGKSTPATPVVGTTTTLPPAAPPITPAGSASASQTANPQVAQGSPGPNTTYSGVLSQLAANSSANNVYNGIDFSNIGGTFAVSPISQTFTTPPPKSQKSNYGIFVSSVDIWFNAKPTGSSPQFPAQLKIVETNNGIPTQNVVGSCLVQYNNIKVSDTPDSINIGTTIGINQTSTKFRFADPIYLQPATTYALVLYSESPDYEVYIADVGQTDISTAGNGTRRISSQPSVGSFFKSQNASAWTAIPNQMLMFVLNKAVFDTAPVSFTFNINPINQFTPYDELILHSSDLNFSPTSLTYKVLTTLANTFGQDSAYTQVIPDSVFDFGQDLKTSSLNGTRRRIIIPGNSQCLLAQVSIQSNDPDVTPAFNSERLSAITSTNVINAGGVNQEIISITSGGNHINANNIVVTIGPPDLADGTQALANVMVLTGNSVAFVTITNPGSGYSKAPTITISEPGAPANATAVIAGENAPSGGNAIARYITRQITLAQGMDSGDLRVYLQAIRPAGTDICVYYKVLSSTDTQQFINVPWVKMAIVQDLNSPDQKTPINLQFCPSLGPNGLPSGSLSYFYNGTQYPVGGTFKFFAIKIVLLAGDSTVVPLVTRLQINALPGG
jgi:hypothetical protein